MSKTSSKAPNPRQLRVGENIRHAIADILARGDVFDDLLVDASITVSEVRVSPDLKEGTVYFMPLGGLRRDEILEALNKHAGEFRHLVASRVRLKYATRLVFKLDTTYDEAKKVIDILYSPEVRRDIEKVETEQDE